MIKDQLNRIEDKIDRIARASTQNTADINWIKGGVKIAVPIIMTLVSFMAYELYKQVIVKEPIRKELKDERKEKVL